MDMFLAVCFSTCLLVMVVCGVKFAVSRIGRDQPTQTHLATPPIGKFIRANVHLASSPSYNYDSSTTSDGDRIMWRTAYRVGLTVGTFALIGAVWNDPKFTMFWTYLTTTQHGPVEYLIMWTFGLVLLNALENLLGVRDEGRKAAQTATDSALLRIESSIDRLHTALSRSQTATERS